MSGGRWTHCVRHEGGLVDAFVRDYFQSESRRLLLVGAAGFDPRSMIFPTLVAEVAGPRTTAVMLREERPSAASELAAAGDEHSARLQQLLPAFEVVRFPIFADDLAVIGGRRAVSALAEKDLSGITDIVLDVSALSVGVYYPAFAFLLLKARERGINLHLVLASSPRHDGSVARTFSDKVGSPHGLGYQVDLSVERRANEGRLWLPQLALGARADLERIYAAVGPDDVCPILPFPASDPREADVLAAHYLSEFESTWQVDARGVLLASDSNPLDAYRSLVRLHAARKNVFGGNRSTMILTPLGSKAAAVGMLLAAVELELPVVSAEVLSYSWNQPAGPVAPRLVHLWINGPIL